ncbi:MAG: ester cyclase, partial [Chloroflexota bacterium]|nr:ester cyclase [Chloroflexota bacterium]
RWTGRGTQQGELFGIPPTGKPVTVSGMTMARIQDGQGVEAWTQSDNLGVLQQLGAIPPPGQAAS